MHENMFLNYIGIAFHLSLLGLIHSSISRFRSDINKQFIGFSFQQKEYLDRLSCVLLCGSSPFCSAVNFYESSQRCELFDSLSIKNGSIENRPGVNYIKAYQQASIF